MISLTPLITGFLVSSTIIVTSKVASSISNWCSVLLIFIVSTSGLRSVNFASFSSSSVLNVYVLSLMSSLDSIISSITTLIVSLISSCESSALPVLKKTTATITATATIIAIIPSIIIRALLLDFLSGSLPLTFYLSPCF